jgi:molybdopterin/thiamine biosynthesis adenylyltransferase
METITIVGCGFIGSHLSDELPKLAYSQDLYPYKFRFIDFDRWERRNAANQNVTLEDATKNEYKAVTCAAVAKRYSEFNESEAITEKITATNLHDMLEDSILVIDAVDNIPTRQLLWAYGKSGKAPVMHCGISRQGQGMINWSTPDFDTFPFKPQNVAGRNLNNQDFEEPPCEMYKYRASGMTLFQAIAKSTAFFFGRDPWEYLGGTAEPGLLTCWTSGDRR